MSTNKSVYLQQSDLMTRKRPRTTAPKAKFFSFIDGIKIAADSDQRST